MTMKVEDVGRPVAGLYRVRLTKGGPWVPVRIWDEAERDPETGDLIEDEKFRCEVNGREADPERYAERVNCFGEPITRPEYEYLLSVNGWARDYAPAAPEANPDKPVDLATAPPIF